jgi:hypothetical protein
MKYHKYEYDGVWTWYASKRVVHCKVGRNFETLTYICMFLQSILYIPAEV